MSTQLAAQRCAPAFAAAQSKRQGTRRSAVSVVRAAREDKPVPQLASQLKDTLRNCLMGAAAAALVALPAVAPDQLAPPAHAGLVASDPVKNAKALLRYALPIDNKNPIRRVQRDLESISEALRIPGSKSLGPISRSVRSAQSVLERDGAKIEAAFAPAKAAAGRAALDSLKQSLAEFSEIIDAGDKQAVPIKQQEALNFVGDAEEAMVGGFPFEVPKEYASLPQLKGRAAIDMAIKFKTPREDNARGGVLHIVVDGYNAPVTAGEFVDLVSRGFYDGMAIQRADGFVVQTGKPDGDSEGFVENGQIRKIPFEVMVEGDKVPVYEETLEDNGRFNEQPVLPFNAFGTLALAREEFDANSGSSQIFFLLKESELTPTGSNLLDGRYAVFGYVVEGSQLLKEVEVGDTVEYAKLISGLENLQRPKSS